MLAERAKDRTNEWRSFVRQVEVMCINGPHQVQIRFREYEYSAGPDPSVRLQKLNYLHSPLTESLGNIECLTGVQNDETMWM